MNPVNDAPSSSEQSVTTDEDVALPITLSGSDTETNPENLTYEITALPTNGSLWTGGDTTGVEITGLGEPILPYTISGRQVTYKGNQDFNGSDTFQFKVTDRGDPDTCTSTYCSPSPALTSATAATVSITLNSVNDAPVAVTDTGSTNEDTPLTFLASELAANDTDADGDALTVSAVTGGANTHGTVSLESGNVTYTPDANYSGSASFVYTVSDGDGGTDTGMVDVTVNPVNDAPVAADDPVTVIEDTVANLIDVLLNDDDEDGDTLTITGVTQGANGSVSFTSSGVTYTPGANFFGSDVFTYTISDGSVDTASGTVNVTVTAVNDEPVASLQSVETDEDAPLTITLLGARHR